MRFSGLRVLKEGLTGNKGWTPHWRNHEPKGKHTGNPLYSGLI